MPCSSLTLSTKDRHHFLARTMDFTLDPGSSVLLLPRGQSLPLSRAGNYTRIRYAILGMGSKSPMPKTLYDGVNENGIMGAMLYYPGAVYAKNAYGTQNPINPLSVLLYLLGNSKSLVDVRALSMQMTLIDEGNDILGYAPPLHFIFSDRSGGTLIMEPDACGMSYYENTIGVLSNAPSYPWHETNLRNYIGVNPCPHSPLKLDKKTFAPFGQGSGTWGLPGDFTGPSRFVRVAYMKQYVRRGENEIDGMNQCMQILSSVNIPQGAVMTKEGHADYTRYTCAICAQSLTYYFYTYACRRVAAVVMTDEKASGGQVIEYAWPEGADVLFL